MSLAVKYRPATFDSVVGQEEVRKILQNQLETNTIQNAYLFCGGAGTGKTTCARIFANEINKGQGSPIELDAASHNSVDDVRDIIVQAQTASLDSEYKVFILDEVHMLSTSAWNAMLKLLEEPPKKSVFILATTDPQKIPATILSRVQRYNFQRISQQGIVDRLNYILDAEGYDEPYEKDDEIPFALEYIAKVADGGMRDAITMLDKCLAYSKELTIDSVVKALGLADYDVMFNLLDSIINRNAGKVTEIIDSIHRSGKDLKVFIKTFTTFVTDVCVYQSTGNYTCIQIPQTYDLSKYDGTDKTRHLLTVLIKLGFELRWETTPKSLIEGVLLLECYGDK